MPSYRYCRKLPIKDWKEHMEKKLIQLSVRKFSIVYKHYYAKKFRNNYVGVSHSPLTRPSEYLGNARNVLPRTGKSHNFVSYKIFTGARRKIDAYDEECKIYHNMPTEYRSQRNHPAHPDGIDRRCQVQNCTH